MIEQEESKIVILTEFLEQKLRKEAELKFYLEEIRNLEEKVAILQKEIKLNNLIIECIRNEDGLVRERLVAASEAGKMLEHDKDTDE